MLVVQQNKHVIENYKQYFHLRGKILNVFSVSLSKIADNNEIQNLIQSLGCGIGKNFELSKLRYEKIILNDRCRR